jgi:hypothetical protein
MHRTVARRLGRLEERAAATRAKQPLSNRICFVYADRRAVSPLEMGTPVKAKLKLVEIVRHIVS